MDSDFLTAIPTPPVAAISTGNAAVDDLLGAGLPRGRIIELFGPTGCGKTTLALRWIAAAQGVNATVVFVDADRAIDCEWAQACGVDLEELAIVRPDHRGHVCAMVEQVLRTFTIDLVVIDSATDLADLDSGFAHRSLRRL